MDVPPRFARPCELLQGVRTRRICHVANRRLRRNLPRCQSPCSVARFGCAAGAKLGAGLCENSSGQRRYIHRHLHGARLPNGAPRRRGECGYRQSSRDCAGLLHRLSGSGWFPRPHAHSHSRTISNCFCSASTRGTALERAAVLFFLRHTRTALRPISFIGIRGALGQSARNFT